MNQINLKKIRWWMVILALVFTVLTAEAIRNSWQVFVVDGPERSELTLSVIGKGITSPKPGTLRIKNGTAVVLEAEGKEGWEFSRWEGPVADPTSPRTTLNFEKDQKIQAVFVEILPPYYTFSLEIDGHGSTYPSPGEHPFEPDAQGSTMTVSAVPSAGYQFEKWTVKGTTVSADLTYDFTLERDLTLKAHFIPLFQVTANATRGGTACVSPGGYELGAQVKAVATPNPGYGFVKWTENNIEVSTSPQYSFTTAGSRHLKAHFSPLYSISVSSTAGGQAAASLNTGFEGARIKVTAQADPGYAFVRWTESGRSGGLHLGPITIPIHYVNSPIYEFVLQGNRSLTAHFVPVYTVNVSSTAGGTVKAPREIYAGDIGMVIAVPDEGYGFVKWTEEDQVASTSPVYEFKGERHISLKAHFTAAYQIAAVPAPHTGGTVSGEGLYNRGASVTVTAYPVEHASFTGWEENGEMVSTTAAYTFTAEKNRSLTAHFIAPVTINVNPTPQNSGKVFGGGIYKESSSVTVIAKGDTGYQFEYWLQDGERISDSPTYTLTADRDKNLEAVFQPVAVYRVELEASAPQGGSVYGGGRFNEGSSVTVFAVPKLNYRFINWTEAGVPVSTDSRYTFEATENRTLRANFAPLYLIYANTEPAAGGRIEGRGYYGLGEQATLEAVPAYGYRFDHWADGAAVLGYDRVLTFITADNRKLTAHFLPAHWIKLSTDPADGGAVFGGGLHDVGAAVTVEAVPNEWYAFVKWTEGGRTVGSSPTYEFIMEDKPRDLVAHFIPTYRVNVSAAPPEGGSVSGGGIFSQGESITVHAVPAEGYRFVRWTEDGVHLNSWPSYNLTVNRHRNLVAQFVMIHEIQVSASPGAGGSVSGAGLYDHGDTVTVVATPAPTGYRFVNWTENGLEVSVERSFSFTASQARSLVANFAEIPTYQITLNASPLEGGSVIGESIYNEGDTVTVTAVPSSAFYTFAGWFENEILVSSERGYTFTAAADRNLVAHFNYWDGVLYHNGTEHTSFVQGYFWDNNAYNVIAKELEKRDDHLFMHAAAVRESFWFWQNTNGRVEVAWVTDQPVDLTGFSRVYVEWMNDGSSNSSNYSSLVASTNQMGGESVYNTRHRSTAAFARRVNFMNVSSLNGLYYIRIHARDDDNANARRSRLSVYRIWLE